MMVEVTQLDPQHSLSHCLDDDDDYVLLHQLPGVGEYYVQDDDVGKDNRNLCWKGEDVEAAGR